MLRFQAILFSLMAQDKRIGLPAWGVKGARLLRPSGLSLSLAPFVTIAKL